MERVKEKFYWADQLQYDRFDDPLPTVDNACRILKDDPFLRGRIAVSAFDSRRYVTGKLPWGEKGVRAWDEGDDAGLRWYMQSEWNISNRAVVADAVELVARQTRFHPVRAYLESLTWDGTPRLDTMLVTALKAEDTPFVRTVTRKWMVAACKRVFEPGCKFDTMLVLISPGQGRGKSMLGDVLAGEWFKDGLRDITRKDALQELQGKWIVELGELSGLKRAENESVKQFLSCRKDTYRPAYGRYALDFPRQCVFLGSTNEREFIMDETGGRRFWPVEIYADAQSSPQRINDLREARDQLWAEAMEYYRRGETVWLETAEDIAAAEAQQIRHSARDEWEGMVQAYLARLLPRDWDNYTPEARRAFIQSGAEGEVQREWVSIAEIRYELLGEEVTENRNATASKRLGKIMNTMEGWKMGKFKTTAFGRQKGFVRCNCET